MPTNLGADLSPTWCELSFAYLASFTMLIETPAALAKRRDLRKTAHFGHRSTTGRGTSFVPPSPS